jgi:hypothetical protein
VIQRLARSQRTPNPNRARVARTVSPVIRSFVRPSSIEAHLGGEIQRPQTRVLAELPGSVVQQLPQGLSLLGIEGPTDGVRMLRAWLKRFRESLLVEGVYGVARGLRIAAQLVSDLVGVLAPVAGEQDLATAQSEGIRRGSKPASRDSRSASVKGRTKMGRFMLWRITID